MMHLPASVRVYLCLSPCDMRRSFDGLHALVRDHLELDPFRRTSLPVRQQAKRSAQDSVLGPGRVRHLGETSGRGLLRDSVRRTRLAAF